MGAWPPSGQAGDAAVAELNRQSTKIAAKNRNMVSVWSSENSLQSGMFTDLARPNLGFAPIQPLRNAVGVVPVCFLKTRFIALLLLKPASIASSSTLASARAGSASARFRD